jgi:hypothetical protein
VRDLIARIGAIQLDAINVLRRTQYLVVFSRLGPYDVSLLHRMTGPSEELFEYWGHAAAVLPATTQPLFRWRMQEHAALHARVADDAPARPSWLAAGVAYTEAVFDEVRDRGPLAASGLSDPRPQRGEWWDRRSTGRRALEWLFTTGRVAAWRSETFERIYDLPERVLPAAVLAAPTPRRDDAQRALLLTAAHALGVGTLADLADYFRIRPGEARERVAELIDCGDLVEVVVEGWTQKAYCPPDVQPRRPARGHATLLSPFDSLIWARDRTRRLFGFDYRIEVYVPEAKRRFGYFVLPLLLDDSLVARLDLKADRRTGTLRVPAAHLEPGADARAVAAAAAEELDALRAWLGLEHTEVGTRGDLTATLRREVRARRRVRREEVR